MRASPDEAPGRRSGEYMDSTQPILAYYEETKWDYKYLWKSEETLAIHFGYWDELATSHAASLMRINAVLAQLMELRAGERVLDAGCGFGGSALWLASTIGCQVVGVNITPYQVAKARQSARELGLADLVQFALSDFRRTGLRSASFDAVWALESVVHANDKAEFVAEASRLLKPGGRLAIAEYLLRDDPPVVGDEFRPSPVAAGLGDAELAHRTGISHNSAEKRLCRDPGHGYHTRNNPVGRASRPNHPPAASACAATEGSAAHHCWSAEQCACSRGTGTRIGQRELAVQGDLGTPGGVSPLAAVV